MKIFYISTSPLPSTEANAVHVMKMCQAFVRNGHQVKLFARRGTLSGEIFSFYGVQPCFDIVFAKWPRLRGWGSLYYACQTLHRISGKPDLFYSRNALALALISVFFNDVNCICESHVLPAGFLQQRLQRWLCRRPTLKNLVVISQALKEDYLKLFPELENKILVAHDGADPAPAECEKKVILHGRKNALKIGYSGRLIMGKGVSLILGVAKLCPEFDFHLFGGSPDEVSHWRAKAAANVFFYGHVPHSDLQNYYAAMDAMLAPLQRSIHLEGDKYDIARWTSPLKIFEYMAFGKPIICSTLPVLREILQDGKTALFCAPDEPAAWAAALNTLNSDQELRIKLGKAAQQEFLHLYTWRARAETVLASIGA